MRRLAQDLLTTLVLFFLSYDWYTKDAIAMSIVMLMVGFLSLHFWMLDIYDYFRPEEFADEAEDE